MHRFILRPPFQRVITPGIIKTMSSSYSNLPENVRELVSGTHISESHTEQSEAEKKEVASWIAKASDASFASQSTIPSLNVDLTSKTYLVGGSITVADIAVYGVLHPIVSKLSPSEYYSTPALTRYFDHIQNNAAIRANASAPPVVLFDLENAPKQERKAEEPSKKKKEKKEETAAVETSDADPSAKSKKMKAKEKATEKVAEVKEAVKEKKEKGKKEPAAASTSSGKQGESSKAGAASGDAGSGEPIPSMIDLRVGRIVDIKVHPDADGLYVEQVDLGEEGGPRTVISGLVHYIPIEKMRDQYVVAVCNLKPANMRGIKSHAMLLCATSKAGKDGGIELVQPPEGSSIGERIFFEGYEENEPISQLNPKKKIFETIQPGFTVLESHEAAWVDPATNSAHRIQTGKGVCMAPTHIGGSLS